MDKQYIKMCATPEIQAQRGSEDDSRFYVKEDIWGFRDSDAKDRRQQLEALREWFAKKHPEKPLIKDNPLLYSGEITTLCYPLGEDGDNDCAIVYHVLCEYPDKFIWLPRSEDIQEMIGSRYPLHALYDLSDFIQDDLLDIVTMRDKEGEPIGFTSPNQRAQELTAMGFTTMTHLWLAFYMNEAHQKTWTEEGWQ